MPELNREDIVGAINEQESANSSDLNQSMYLGGQKNPDRHAKVVDFAKRNKLPTDIVDRNFERWSEAERQTTDAKDVTSEFPGLGKYLQNPDNSAVSSDDLDNLKVIDKNSRAIAGKKPEPFGFKYAKEIKDATRTGWHDLEASTGMLGIAFGFGDTRENFVRMAEANKSAQRLRESAPDHLKDFQQTIQQEAGDLNRATKRFMNGFEEANKGKYLTALSDFYFGAGMSVAQVLDIGQTFVFNPREASQFIAQNASSSLPALITTPVAGVSATAIGTAVGGPGVGALAGIAGTATGAWAGTAFVEIGATMNEALRDKGVDITNPDELQNAFQDPALRQDIIAQAKRKGITTASAEAIFAFIGGTVVRRMGKGFGRIATGQAVEAVGEGVGEVAGTFARTGEVDLGEGVIEAFAGLGQSAITTGTLEVVGEVKDRQKSEKLKTEVAELRTNLSSDPVLASGQVAKQLQKASDAVSGSKILSELATATQASKTRERLPENIKELVATATQGEEDSSRVYFQLDQWDDAFIGQGQSPAEVAGEIMGDGGKAYTEAKASNTNLEIPLDVYAQKVSGNKEVNDNLQKIARMAPDGMTLDEAKSFVEKVPLLMDTIARESVEGNVKTSPEFDASAELIGKAVEAKALETGRDALEAQKIGKVWERRFRARTIRRDLGELPFDLFQQEGGIQAEQIEAGTVPQVPEKSRPVLQEGAEGLQGSSQLPSRLPRKVSAYDPSITENLQNFQALTGETPLAGTAEILRNELRNLIAGGLSLEDAVENRLRALAGTTNPMLAEIDTILGAPVNSRRFIEASLRREIERYVLLTGGEPRPEALSAHDKIIDSLRREFKQEDNHDSLERHALDIEREERKTGKAYLSNVEKQKIADDAKSVGIDGRQYENYVRSIKREYPVKDGWAPIEYTGINTESNNTPVFRAIPPKFSVGPDGGTLKHGTQAYAKQVDALATMALNTVQDLIHRSANGDKNAEKILSQRTWYKAMRSRIRRELGGLGDIFADFLGATSPNTPVKKNWEFSIGLLGRATKGDFDALLPKWEKHFAKVDKLEAELKTIVEGQRGTKTLKAIKESKEYQAKLAQLKKARKFPNRLLPKQKNGKKYGFNGKNIARAMAGMWRKIRIADPDIGRGGQAPKAITFSGNLIGYTDNATIDIWATRFLDRIAGSLRVPPVAESGLSGYIREDLSTTLQFGMGQDVFAEAVKKISAHTSLGEMGTDDLQAVMWFVEKEIWGKNGWTSAEGEGGSFELEADLSANSQQDRIKELRKTIRSKLTSPHARGIAQAELDTKKGTLDRFVGLVSPAMSKSAQGLDSTPSGQYLGQMANEIAIAVYRADSTASVIASKMLPTIGLYGSEERSLDIEVVAKSDFNPLTLRDEIVRQGEKHFQDSVALQKVVTDPSTEINLEIHRPHIEIYFKEMKSIDEVRPIIDELLKDGAVDGFTLSVDGRRTTHPQTLAPAVGIRFAYVPEFAVRYDGDITVNGVKKKAGALTKSEWNVTLEEKENELQHFANRLIEKHKGVLDPIVGWHEADVRFSHEYGNITGKTEGEPGATDKRVWAGRPLSEGIESANRQLRADVEKRLPKPRKAPRDVPPESDEFFGAVNPETRAFQQADEARPPRGRTIFGPASGNPDFTIQILERANRSTWLHESGHVFLEQLATDAEALSAIPKEQRTAQQEQVLKDWDTTLKWFNVKDRAEIQTEQHETWAETLEQYFMTGKTPSEALRSVFRRYKIWLKKIYNTLTGMRVNLTPEVSEVMDRLIATDEEISEAKATMGTVPLSDSPVHLGLTGRPAQKYLELVAEVEEAGNEALLARVLRETKNKETTAWKKEEAQVRAEIVETLNSEPVYVALFALQKGTLPDGSPYPEGQVPAKLSKEAVLLFHGVDALSKLPKGIIEPSGVGGVSPDVASDLYGFSSGDALLKALTTAVPYKEAVKILVAEEMGRRHEDIVRDIDALAEEAILALHSDKKSLVLRRQLEILVSTDFAKFKKLARKILGAIPTDERLKAEAKARIARSKVRNLLPSSYLQAQARAGKASREAFLRGDFQGAFDAKNTELFNHELYREAVLAKKKVASIVKFMQKFEKLSVRQRIGKAGGGHLDQIDALIERFDLRVSQSLKAIDRRKSLLSWFDAQIEAGLTPVISENLLIEAEKKHYKDATFEELVDIENAVRSIEKIASLKNKLIKNAEIRDLEVAVNLLTTSLEANAKKGGEIPIETRLPQDDLRRLGASFLASHRKLSSYARQMDGFNEGGIMWQLFVRPVNEAGDAQALANEKATNALKEIFSVYSIRDRADMYVRKDIPEIGGGLTKMARLMVALNWGNEDNRVKMMTGRNWTQHQVDAILDTLDERDWRFVQSLWNYIDTFWPETKRIQESVSGIAPEKVLPSQVNTKFGVFRGGYFPLKYDDRLPQVGSEKVATQNASQLAKDSMRGARLRSTTRHGHREARVEGVNLPVRLDFGTIFEHIGEVIHDQTHYEMLIDLNKLLASAKVQEAILKNYGDIAFKQIKSAIADIALGDTGSQTAFETSINWLRAGVSISAMGWNLSTAMLQPLGLTQSIVVLRGKGETHAEAIRWLAVGIKRFIGDPAKMNATVEMVQSKSALMANRARTQMREINEIRNQLRSDGKLDAIKQTFFWPIVKMQMVADYPTWIAMYEKQIAKAGDPKDAKDAKRIEDRAVALADQAVLDAQGGGQIKDLAQVQRGGPLLKLWTNFMSYFVTTHNLTAEAISRTNFRSVEELGRLATDFLLLYTIPSALGLVIREGLRGDEDDDDSLASKLSREQISYMMGTLVGIREMGGIVQGFRGYEGPAGTRFFSEFGRLIQQIGQGEADEALFRSLNNVAGILFHYPANQIDKTIRGISALTDGDTQRPTAPLLGPPRKR